MVPKCNPWPTRPSLDPFTVSTIAPVWYLLKTIWGLQCAPELLQDFCGQNLAFTWEPWKIFWINQLLSSCHHRRYLLVLRVKERRYTSYGLIGAKSQKHRHVRCARMSVCVWNCYRIILSYHHHHHRHCYWTIHMCYIYLFTHAYIKR